MARRKLHSMAVMRIVDHELAAVVVSRRTKEQGRRKIGPHADGRAGERADGVVHMIAEGLPAPIAVEERREYLERQSRGNEQGAIGKGAKDQIGREQVGTQATN